MRKKEETNKKGKKEKQKTVFPSQHPIPQGYYCDSKLVVY
jgi:hypothetical protein